MTTILGGIFLHCSYTIATFKLYYVFPLPASFGHLFLVKGDSSLLTQFNYTVFQLGCYSTHPDCTLMTWI